MAVHGGNVAHTGLLISTFLFNIYVIGMVVKLEKVRLGVEVNGIRCGALLYAYDVVLIF